MDEDLPADLVGALKGRVMLLGVGAQKAGTSWLHHYLAQRPDVLASPIKELHFFDAWLGPLRLAGFDDRSRALAARMRGPLARLGPPARRRAILDRVAMIGDRSAYLRHFAGRLNGETFLLDVTPGYALLDDRAWMQARRFLETAGLQVRLLYLMRDPVERHYSALRMEMGPGATAAARGAFRASLARGGLLAHGRYDRRLRALWRVFGRERVAVGFYEHVFAEPELHLRALTDQLGLRWREPDVAARINASPEGEALSGADIAAGVAALQPAYDFVNRRFGAAKPATWHA